MLRAIGPIKDIQTYRGMRHGPKDVMDKIARGETVSPLDYYLRAIPLFET